MSVIQVKSHAKINLALNITCKLAKLHKIESIVSFINLHDLIFIKQIKEPNHRIHFYGNFSQKISKNNTVEKLFKILDEKKLLKDKKFLIKIKKNIPQKAGLGGGSMNAASILKILLKKKIIKASQKKIKDIFYSILDCLLHSNIKEIYQNHNNGNRKIVNNNLVLINEMDNCDRKKS